MFFVEKSEQEEIKTNKIANNDSFRIPFITLYPYLKSSITALVSARWRVGRTRLTMASCLSVICFLSVSQSTSSRRPSLKMILPGFASPISLISSGRFIVVPETLSIMMHIASGQSFLSKAERNYPYLPGGEHSIRSLLYLSDSFGITVIS